MTGTFESRLKPCGMLEPPHPDDTNPRDVECGKPSSYVYKDGAHHICSSCFDAMSDEPDIQREYTKPMTARFEGDWSDMTGADMKTPIAASAADYTEALAELDTLTGATATRAALALIRTALESAQRESAAWEALNDSCGHVEITAPGGHVNVWSVAIEHGTIDGRRRTDFDAPTRLEALEAAAAWVKEQKGNPGE